MSDEPNYGDGFSMGRASRDKEVEALQMRITELEASEEMLLTPNCEVTFCADCGKPFVPTGESRLVSSEHDCPEPGSLRALGKVDQTAAEVWAYYRRLREQRERERAALGRIASLERENAELRADSTDPDDMPHCNVSYFADGHDGAGWYYWDAEYADEGSCGAFATLAEAVLHASNKGGYMIGAIREDASPPPKGEP